MTIPIWLPFALLAAWCASCPPPSWMRRLAGLDWLVVGVWASVLVAGLAFWAGFWFVVLTLAGVA